MTASLVTPEVNITRPTNDAVHNIITLGRKMRGADGVCGMLSLCACEMRDAPVMAECGMFCRVCVPGYVSWDAVCGPDAM